MDLISLFMRNGTKTSYNLNKPASFNCNVLLLSGMKVLIKGKIIHKINELIMNIQYFSGTGVKICYNVL